jgi:hypothetical protein
MREPRSSTMKYTRRASEPPVRGKCGACHAGLGLVCVKADATLPGVDHGKPRTRRLLSTEVRTQAQVDF